MTFSGASRIVDQLADMHLLGDVNPDRYDVFLGACGADQRAYRSLKVALKRGFRFDEVWLFSFAERASIEGSEAQKRAYGRALNSYRRVRSDAVLIPARLKAPRSATQAFRREFRKLPAQPRVLLDISVFTKPVYMALIDALRRLNVVQLDVCYTEAMSYIHPTPSGYAISKGPFVMRPIPGFVGDLDLSKKRALVLLLGFEGVSARSLHSQVEPHRTVLINGFPSYLLHYKDISILENDALVRRAARNEVRYAPANDPFETFNVLKEVCQGFPLAEYTVVVAPLGTKPMSLGAAMYALENPDICLVHPEPQAYHNSPSKGWGSTWLYRLRLPLLRRRPPGVSPGPQPLPLA